MGWFSRFWEWVAAERGEPADLLLQASTLLEQGDIVRAQQICSEILELHPDHCDARCLLAELLMRQADWRNACLLLDPCLNGSPERADLLVLLGRARLQLRDLDGAMAAHQRALTLDAGSADACRGVGDTYRAMGRLLDAISAYEQAIVLRPHLDQARWNLATTLLLTGDYARGWHLYQSRFSSVVGVQPIAQPVGPLWYGGMPRRGDKLLLVAEQGLGDTIQFVRYVSVLIDVGVEVTVLAHPVLCGLLERAGFPVYDTHGASSACEPGTPWLPLLSLPGLLGVSPAAPLVTSPYLKPPEEVNQRWQQRFSQEQRLVVGLNWQGNPAVEVSNFAGRSLTLNLFTPLTGIQGVAFLSLQKGYGAEQLADCAFRDRFLSFQELLDQTWDFQDAAAVIANCDLLITSDTAVAHLAGAMGHPTWLLLQKIPDWRWGLEDETTFWYPSMRLFRQRESGNWREVMDRVAEALRVFVADH